MDQLRHQRGADLKARYERLYPEDEIAEIQRRIHGTGICLTWCTVLDDFVAFHRDDVHSDKVPVGFVSYSSDRELRELFGNDKPDLSLTALRRIHAAKKTGAMVTGSRPNNPSCGRHVSDGHA